MRDRVSWVNHEDAGYPLRREGLVGVRHVESRVHVRARSQPTPKHTHTRHAAIANAPEDATTSWSYIRVATAIRRVERRTLRRRVRLPLYRRCVCGTVATVTRLVWIAVLLVPMLADAGPSKKDVANALRHFDQDGAQPPVRFGIDSRGVHADAATWQDTTKDFFELVDVREPTIATSTDGTAAWAGMRVHRAWQCAGLTGTVADCEEPKINPPVITLLLLEKVGKTWNPVTVHSAIAIPDKALAKAVAGGTTLPPIPSRIDEGAREAVELFKASLADPKQFAASISKRKDAILIGSAPNQKTVGGAKVAATLARWKLALTIRDGIAAGTTASKTVAWVAANVDARPAGKPTASPTPYRVLCIYEQTKAKAWQLVAVEFSFPASPPATE
ncbi:MAG: hypothetical protein JWP01_2567 [Myxococcales bacterium]|nr:hypothetical protein [Myxococcales bacterium]